MLSYYYLLQYYQFTSFAMALNELEASHGREGARLCPTDSRLRPDVRFLERGDVDGAAREKTRLEDKQRACRKHAKKHPQGSAPRLVITLITTFSQIF